MVYKDQDEPRVSPRARVTSIRCQGGLFGAADCHGQACVNIDVEVLQWSHMYCDGLVGVVIVGYVLAWSGM